MFETLALAAALATPAPQHLPTMDVHAPHAVLKLQIADTETERETGLMSVTSLAPHTGMIFVFNDDAMVEFWMKDTLVPLDMVFIGSDGTVRRVFANVPVVPLSAADAEIPRRSAIARYVIELPAGEAEKDGITQGTRLRDVTPYP